MNAPVFDDDFVARLLPAFIEEANEQTANFERLLLELEDAPGDHELLDALFRCAHTVKGSAGVFGLDRVVAFTHHVESVLDRLREGQLPLTPGLSTLLLQCNDAIQALVAGAPDHDTEDAARAREALVARLHEAGGAPAAPKASPPAAAPAAAAGTDAGTGRHHVAVRFGPDTLRNGMDPLSILRYLDRFGECRDMRFDRAAVPPLDAIDPENCHVGLEFDVVGTATAAQVEGAFDFVRDDARLSVSTPAPEPAAAIAPAPGPAQGGPAAPPPARDAAAPAGADGGYIRVLAHRLDEVINLLGELVIAGAGASTLAQRTRQRPLIEAHQQVTRLIEGIRNSTLKLRMVPVGDTFTRFRRVVRDVAAELGKDVAFEIAGGDTELDKAVVERIADPLMHLVRNALDHGLETPAQRLAAGKPAQGRLTLSACHEAGSILIRIIDDGRGIQRDKVLQRAWQRGLLEPGTVPPDEEIFKLIFEPGFSTAEKVTNLSGRGVGMDVVRRDIEALRGSVTIGSTEGRGSSIEIRLPLTLAIIDGFLVGVGASRFIFPLESVVEVIASRPSVTPVDARGRGCVDVRGRLLPLVDLRSLYALEPAQQDERGSVVVLRSGARRFGVAVDALLGQHQTVIKPLGRMLRALRGIAGSSILGTGEVALIFDVEALGKQAGAAPSVSSTADSASGVAFVARPTVPGDRP